MDLELPVHAINLRLGEAFSISFIQVFLDHQTTVRVSLLRTFGTTSRPSASISQALSAQIRNGRQKGLSLDMAGQGGTDVMRR